MKNLILLFFISLSFNSFAQQSEYDKFIEEGKKKLQNNELSLALIQFQQAIKIDSSKIKGHYGVGVVQAAFCHQLNIYCNEAISTLSYVIELDPNNGKSYYNRGNCKNTTGHFSDAILDLNIAIKKHPNKHNYYMSRTFAYLQLGDKEMACKDMKKAAELNSPTANKKLLEYECQ